MERAKTFFGRDHDGYVGKEKHSVRNKLIDFIFMQIWLTADAFHPRKFRTKLPYRLNKLRLFMRFMIFDQCRR